MSSEQFELLLEVELGKFSRTEKVEVESIALNKLGNRENFHHLLS
jgi:hypothetical protein